VWLQSNKHTHIHTHILPNLGNTYNFFYAVIDILLYAMKYTLLTNWLHIVLTEDSKCPIAQRKNIKEIEVLKTINLFKTVNPDKTVNYL